jgi:predicted DNA binding CopG/RHH family protein
MEIKLIKIGEIKKQICRKCNKIKLLNDFYFRNDSKKYRTICISCWHKIIKEYRENNKGKIREMKLKWQRNNPKKRQEINKRYLIKNREKINKYNRDYKREKQSLNVRLIANCRSRIWKALKGVNKSIHTISFSLIGCDIEELKKHLEQQFKDGMNWNNYGKWHIDHIKPCLSFNLLDQKQILKCFNYKNLQPLWAKENRLKNNLINRG